MVIGRPVTNKAEAIVHAGKTLSFGIVVILFFLYVQVLGLVLHLYIAQHMRRE